jgi:hypothetical protein
MVRTQVYLTEQERSGLLALAEASGKKQSELIREAVDGLIARFDKTRRLAVVDNAAGMWKGRKDLPDFGAARKSWDRS